MRSTRDDHDASIDSLTRALEEARQAIAQARADRDALKAALTEIANMDRLEGEEGQPMHVAAAALRAIGQDLSR